MIYGKIPQSLIGSLLLVAVLLIALCIVPLWGSGCLQFSVPQKETLESSWVHPAKKKMQNSKLHL